MYKKITALILCFALSGILLTGAFKTGAAAEVCAVYLSSDGDDSNSGITADKPLKTLKAAVNTVNRLELVGYNRVINIVKCGWNGISFDMSGCTPYTEMITLTAPSGLTVWSTSDMYLAGPLTLDADYGNSRTQSALNIYTGGYPFTLLSKDQKGNSNIYAGFNSRLGLTADEESGNIEWKSDLKITLAGEREMTVGKVIAGNCSDPGHNVIYGTADILIDNPNLTVSSLKLGSNGNFTNTGTQSNRFKGISITVNSVKEIATLEGATYYNAVYTEELRLIFNNGTADRITDTLIYGKYGNTNIQAAKKWIVKNGTDTPIKAGAEPGVFTVVGGSAVIFTDDENPKLTYTSEKGNITVPAGSYTVTVSDTEEYTFSEGVFTAVTDLKDFNLTDIAPAQSGGKILLGFKDESGGYLNRTANLKIKAGERLYAVYTDFPVSGENAVFSVSGFERRGGEKLGIRFILEKRNGFEAATAPLSGMKYGFAAMPEHFLNIGEALTVDNENAAVRTVGDPDFIFFDGREKFTACITGIPEKHYAEGFAVRGFVTYTDLNGNSRTVYTEVSCASLMEATADSALNGGLTDSEKAETARLADNYLSLKRASLESSISNCPDIVRNSVSGNIYYVSESGSDSNDGLSELKPLKTLYGVSGLSLNAGDAVLFERGGVYRTSKKYTDGSSFILKSGVSYGAYGKGQKPVINGSFENYAERKWRKYADNIWYISISNISADPGVLRVTTTKNYSYTGCVKESIDALAREWDFCRDGTNLYMYCQYGEPTNLLNAIEIGFGFDMFKIDNANNITIENLTFTCGGRHAVGASNGAASVTVRGCEFSYIGGSLMSGSDGTRLGNAVEFLGGSSDILVEKCKFSDIYDSGVTFQGLSAKVNGFTARSNVFDKCGLASFEYWLGTAGYAENITVEDNYMSNAGGGFGGIGKRSINAKYVSHIRADGANRISNFIIRSNVLDSAADGACLAALCCYKSSGGSLPTLFRNIYIRKSGEWLLSVKTESAADAAVFSADAIGIDYLKQSFDNKPIVILR